MSTKIILKKEATPLRCHRCSHEWPYSGKNTYVATCPHCRTYVTISKQRIVRPGALQPLYPYRFPPTRIDMQNCTTVGISFRNDILMKIDSERGLIPRSIFLRKILEKTYDNEVNKNTIPQILPKVEPPRESVIPSITAIGDPNTNG